MSERLPKISLQQEMQFEVTASRAVEMFADTLPPKQDSVQHAFVIPAFDELPRLIRLLYSIGTARITENPQSEVIYVINNLQAAREKNAPEYQRNVQTVQLLQLCSELKQANTRVSRQDIKNHSLIKELQLTEQQIWSLYYYLQSAVAVHPVDVTEGLQSVLQVPLYHTMLPGLAKNIGGALAAQRIDSDQYITFIDADCRVTPAFFTELYAKIAAPGPKPEAFLQSLRVEQLDLPEELFAEGLALQAFVYLFASSINQSAVKIMAENIKYFATPSHTVQAQLFKRVFGYPLGMAEDKLFARAVYHAVPEIGRITEPVQVSNRRSSRSYFGASGRELPHGVNGGILDSLEWLSLHVSPEIQTLHKLVSRDAELAENAEYLKLRKKFFDREQQIRWKLQVALFKFVQRVVDATTADMTSEQFQAVVERGVAALPDRYKSVVSEHPFFVSTLAEALWELQTSQEVQESAQLQLKFRTQRETADRRMLPLEEQSEQVQRVWVFLEKYLPELCAPPLLSEPESYVDLVHTLHSAAFFSSTSDLVHLATAQLPFDQPEESLFAYPVDPYA